MYDILIQNGLIVDGSGGPVGRGDIAIKDGKIVKISPYIRAEARQFLDATGLVVAPGFIDCHNHSDADALFGNSCYNSLEQGVTTQITGHCGYSPAPYYAGALPNLRKKMGEEAFATIAAMVSRMDTFLMAADSVRIGANMAFFVGHHNIRGKTMRMSDAIPTAEQLRAMQDDLIEAMEAGCLGLSTGLIYAPSAYAGTQELIELAKTMAPYNGIYSTHVRSESDKVVEAVKEAIYIGEEAGVHVHLSHLKVMGRRNAGLSEKLLQMIDDANRRGVHVTADQYPFCASSAALNSRIPAKYHVGGRESLLERLQDKNIRKSIAVDVADFDSMFLASLPHTPQYEGKTVGQIAQEENQAPADVLCELLLANQGAGQGIYFNQNEQDMMRILAHPNVFCGSDSSNMTEPRPNPDVIGGRHPRGQATMVRRLTLQRDHGLCSLEQMVHRITGAPAKALHLENQGLLKEGYDANITVFDVQDLHAHATYRNPYRPNEGIIWVLVNGEIALQNGKTTGIRAGKILKRGK